MMDCCPDHEELPDTFNGRPEKPVMIIGIFKQTFRFDHTPIDY